MSFLQGLFGPPDVRKLETKRNIHGLIKALRYRKDGSIRKRAASALGELKDAKAVEALCAALKDAQDDVRWYAAEALVRIGAPAVGPLCAALKDTYWELLPAVAEAPENFGISRYARRTAAEALGKIGDARAVEALCNALRDPDRYVCKNAAEALVRIGTPAVEPLCAALLNDAVLVGRAAAAEALGKIGGAHAVEPLCAALKDENEDVRRAAAEALVEIGDARAVEPLIAAVKDENEDVRRLAVTKVTDQSVLAKVAKTDTHAGVRKEAVKKVTDQSLLAEVAMTDDDGEVRTEAVEKITNQSVLAKVAMRMRELNPSDDEWGMGATYRSHEAALARLTDPAAWARVAKGANELSIRELALRKVTDQTVLAEVAMTDTYYEGLGKHAINRLTDPAALAAVAKGAHDGYIRKLAAEKVTGQTALMVASGYGQREVVQALLKEGADINAKLSNGMTALIMASIGGHCEVVQALLKEGADVHAKDTDDMTVLMYASYYGHCEVVKALLDKGAHVNAYRPPSGTWAGGTALSLATDYKTKRLLEHAGAKR